MTTILYGIGLPAIGVAMAWIARPRNGEMSRLLRIRYVESTYAVILTGFIGLRLAAILGGFANMATG